MHQQTEPAVIRDEIDPAAVLEDADAREGAAKEALDAIRHTYHEGTKPLTVARAKVDVMRRGLDRGEGGEWHRK